MVGGTVELTSDIAQWRHAFKLDPAKPLADDALRRICASGTDAIIVGGTDGITRANTADLLARVREYGPRPGMPCVQELSDADAVVPDFDLFLAPIVLNAGEPEWIVGALRDAVKRYGAAIPWDRVVPEGYVILNPSAKAAVRTSADAAAGLDDVLAYARIGERFFHLPIYYMEYSGMFGCMDWVRRAAASLTRSRLFYGGGIAGPEQAGQAASAAHTVVVGNAVYRDLEAALATVDAVRAIRPASET